MGRMAYLAYPIDQANASDLVRRGFYSLIGVVAQRMLDNAAFDITFDPGDAFTVRQDAPVGTQIGVLNRHAAALSDVVLAFIPSGVPTIGVPMEIDRAVASGKVVAVFTDVKSWMLEYDSPRVRVFPLSEDSIDEATVWVSEATAVQDDADPLPVRLLDEARSQTPTRAHPDDAGLDLYVSETTFVDPGQAVDVPCGVAVQLPEWSWGLLTGRSSARRTHGLLIHNGVIDAGYRGPLFVLAENTTDEVVVVKAGMRLAQLIVLPNLTKDLRPVTVDRLDDHPRGLNGFGSSGV